MTGQHEPTVPTPSMLYLVKQVELAVRVQLEDLLRPAGVTALQYTALTVLQRREGTTSAELARNSFVSQQAMAEMVIALERLGLLTRERDEHDRRRLILILSASGEALLARCLRAVGGLETRLTAGMSRAERDQLRDLLDRCRTNLRSR